MPAIEFDTVDFDYLSTDIDNINAKIDYLVGYISSNFSKEQSKDLFSTGFNNMITYLNNEKDRLNNTKTVIKDYKESMSNIEEVYKGEFSNIQVPNVVYREIKPQPLVLELSKPSVQPVILENPNAGSTSSVSYSSTNETTSENLNNPSNEDNNSNNTVDDNNSSDTDVQDITIDDSINNNVDNDNNTIISGNDTNDNTTVEEKKEEKKSSDLANIGLIAGAIGAVGLAGAGAAVAIKKAKDKDDDEDSERDY